MRKFIVTVLAFGIIGFCHRADAAPVGNIANPVLEKGEHGIKIGVDNDFVFKRELDVPDESVELEADFHSAKLSYTIAEKADVYVLLGMMNNALVSATDGSTEVLYDVDSSFTWGVGATLLAYETEGGFRAGIDGKYRSASPEVSKVTVDGTDYSLTDSEAEYSEWQVAFAVSQQMGKFAPYAGVKYSDIKTKAKATVSGTLYETEERGSKNTVGPFVGLSFLPNENISLNVEGRFVDEEAVSVSLAYKF
ncbi:hypothetical protein HY947_04950 [Candidatus Gottesmanbacteria bacterium]|nr:hypothetical protein [Candidatus Gottesmanbacteria bacterium]